MSKKDEKRKVSCGSCSDEGQKKALDYMFWGGLLILALGYGASYLSLFDGKPAHFSDSIFELINTMWWGIAFGVIFMGVLGKIPREHVMKVLGTGTGLKGIFRATLAGVLLDLCSHGILMVGARFYERGASLGQVMAFLIASPWNSISLTLILFALIGLQWTLAFLLLSMVIGIVSGLIIERCVAKGVLPDNPNTQLNGQNTDDLEPFRVILKDIALTLTTRPVELAKLLWDGLLDSRMVLRWMFLGVILASLIRVFLTPEDFGTWFGATLGGLGLTLLAATIIEVCSEGTTPVAADILNRAAAPGNSFAFLMGGVSTDYTELLVLRDVTKSWKIALFLPLVTLPQIVIIALILNMFGG